MGHSWAACTTKAGRPLERVLGLRATLAAVHVIDPSEQHRRRTPPAPAPRRATRQALAYDLFAELGTTAAVAERMGARRGTVLVYLCRERQARALVAVAR